MSDGRPRSRGARANLGVRERGALRKRLEALRSRGDLELRALGARVHGLYKEGTLNEATVTEHAGDLARLEHEMERIDAVLAGREPSSAPPPERQSRTEAERPGRQQVQRAVPAQPAPPPAQAAPAPQAPPPAPAPEPHPETVFHEAEPEPAYEPEPASGSGS